MGKIIVFMNEKGGLGKTSLVFNACHVLSGNKKKKRVLAIDMDAQMANLTYFTGTEKREDLPTMYNVLLQGGDIHDAIVTVKERFDLIPATVNVANISSFAKVSRMRKVMDSIRDGYDYIIIDVSPSPNHCHTLALAVSDYILIPVNPDVTSLKANEGMMETIEEVRDSSNPRLKVLGILFNKNENRTNLGSKVRALTERFAENLDTIVFDTKIRQNVALSECVAAHMGITEYSPRSNGAKDICAFVDEFVRRLEDDGR